MARYLAGLAILLVTVGAAATSRVDTGTIRFASGAERVALIELYTSEGCSSCPPADRWLSRLQADPRLWREFVPVAFHVDYWDYIGWEDRFARPEFSDRQRRYAAEARASTVYTPGFFANGEEWVGWFRGQSFEPETVPVGALVMELRDNVMTAEFAPRYEDYGDLVLNVGVLGMGLQTDVRTGENAGRTLKHDFVALETLAVPLERRDGTYAATLTMPEVTSVTGGQALVAWVVEAGEQVPIQAVGGHLPE